jgi:hypothetical protein
MSAAARRHGCGCGGAAGAAEPPSTAAFDLRNGGAPTYRSRIHARRLRPVSSAQCLQRAHRRLEAIEILEARQV